ncbi:putative phage protein [Fructilactobacillus florum 8D]|uniref:Putative phage protein n=1 Tax=Fructilactobacillus florum 8D TaxID=1221538 RepID=W9EHK9_9LACO|nr:glucosaminidase domain-containing protein [Fructilactobacillus florum]ETO40746.1 putative phage protein [Fructilactobacillus florum 8D]
MEAHKLNWLLLSTVVLGGMVLGYSQPAQADVFPASQVNANRTGSVPLTPDQQDFINQIKPGAIKGWKQSGVLPSIAISQAIIESGWGKSGLASQYHNLFGIKGSYNGQSVSLPTQEFQGGGYVSINDSFRAYPDWSTSIQDYGAFLKGNSRYSNLLGIRDYTQVAQLLHQDGYATSPEYAQTLISCIQRYGLQQIDQEAFDAPDDYTGPVGDGNVTDDSTTADSTSESTQPAMSLSSGYASAYTGYDKDQQHNPDATDTNNGQAPSQDNASAPTASQTPTSTEPTPATPAGKSFSNTSIGTYVFKTTTNVRTAPDVNAPIVAQYTVGEYVHYQGKVQAGGLTWLKYTSYSGQERYVATLN